MGRIITSQGFIDPEIVAEKRAAADYEVTLSPEFEIDGETFQVVLDGHHSLRAAIEAGVEPEINIATPYTNDNVALLERGEVNDFLVITHGGSDFVDALTGEPVWS